MIQKLFPSLSKKFLLFLAKSAEYFDSKKRAKHIAENQQNWLKEALSFEERAKRYFDAMLQFYQERGGNGSPILEIRNPGDETCPECSVKGAMLVFREYGFINRNQWDSLREGMPSPRLCYWCNACKTRSKETTDHLSYLDFLELPLANLPYTQFEFQAPEWVYLLECSLHKIDPAEKFIHPKDCPEGYSVGILVQAYPPNDDWDSDFKKWNCKVLLTGGTHYKAPFEIDPFAELYSTRGYRIMKLDDLDLIPSYDFNLSEEDKNVWSKNL